MFRYISCSVFVCFAVVLSEVQCEFSWDYFNVEKEDLIKNLFFKDWSKKMNASVNEYLDQIVSLMNSQIDYPLVLPDYNLSVNTEIMLIPIFGTLNFHNGAVTEIGSLSRTGEAPVTYIDEVLNVNLALDIKNVKFTGDFVAKFESIGPSGSMTGVIDQISLAAALSLNVDKIQFKLTDFNMDAGKIDLSVDILPVLNWFLNSFIQLLVSLIQWPLLSMISSDIKSQLQTLLDSYTQIFQ